MPQLKNKIITMDDIRSVGGCAPGVRAFFSRYNLDFKSFMKDGIKADDLVSTRDALADDVVKKIMINEVNNGE